MQMEDASTLRGDLELGHGERIPVRPHVLCLSERREHYHAEEALALVHFGQEDGG